MNQAASRAILKLLPSPLPPSLRTTPANLLQVLSRYPNNGIGQKVHQIRWREKSIEDCYWEVTRSNIKLGGSHGKAWGRLVWKGKSSALVCVGNVKLRGGGFQGKPVSEHEERIPGSLKYKWSTGTS
jgi:small subunit ribosomal protein S34